MSEAAQMKSCTASDGAYCPWCGALDRKPSPLAVNGPAVNERCRHCGGTYSLTVRRAPVFSTMPLEAPRREAPLAHRLDHNIKPEGTPC